LFYTDHSAVYSGVIPSTQHRAISKHARKTNHVERFNCTLRQRVSRLVRATLSFSKKLSNHIGASSISFVTTTSREPQHYQNSTTHFPANEHSFDILYSLCIMMYLHNA
jgi:hypothetical protein